MEFKKHHCMATNRQHGHRTSVQTHVHTHTCRHTCTPVHTKGWEGRENSPWVFGVPQSPTELFYSTQPK